MKNIILSFFAITLLFAACQSDTEISKLEKEVDANPTPENVKSLVQLYNDYMTNNPNDAETNGRYCYRAASKEYQINNIRGAINQLEKGIKEYASSSITPSSAFLLAEIHRTKFRQIDKSNWYYQVVNEVYPDSEYAEKSKSFNNTGQNLDKMIDVLRQNIFIDSTQTKLNPGKARQLVGMYEVYAAVKPQAENTPKYLYNIYEIANVINMNNEAVKATEKLYKEYPNYEKSENAMFLTAFLYENAFKDYDKAKALYQEFINKFPNNNFVKDAQFSMEHMGKSDEELLEEILKKNKELQEQENNN